MTFWAAVLGFLGAVAGNLISQLLVTRREDRHWEREQKRRNEELGMQIKFHWGEERLKLYSDFLGQLNQIGYMMAFARDSLDRTQGREVREVLSESKDGLYEKIDEARNIAFRVSLVDSESVDEAVVEAVSQLDSIRLAYSISVAINSIDTLGVNLNVALRDLARSVDTLRVKMKDELGLHFPVSPEGSREVSSSPQSSSRTS